MTRAVLLHPFEGAGLGLAPFRCTGVSQRRNPDSGQPVGMCQFCGNGILFCFHVRSADGKDFIVGSDCVLRTGTDVDDKGLTLEVRRLIAAERRAKRDAQRDRLFARARTARDSMDALPSLFADQPHPNDFYASQGKTLRDYYDWMLRFGGDAARRQAAKLVEEAVASAQSADAPHSSLENSLSEVPRDGAPDV